MGSLDFIRKSAEMISGQPLPNYELIAKDATHDGATLHEIDISKGAARAEWISSFVKFNGVRSFIRDAIGAFNEICEDFNYDYVEGELYEYN